MKILLPASLAMLTGCAAIASSAHAQAADDVIACGGAGLDGEQFLALPRARRIAAMTCIQKAVVATLQSQLPMKVDAITTVTAITASGVTITYANQVDVDGASLGAEVRKQLVAATTGNVCRNADMRETIRLGGRYAYVWNDRNGTRIEQLEIGQCPEQTAGQN